MAAQESETNVVRRRADHCRQGVVQPDDAVKWTLRGNRFGDPGRMLEHAVQRGDKFLL
jgi:hypothetical protein